MKQIFLILALLNIGLRLQAQTSEPAKLAVLAESSGAADAGAVLITQLSSNEKLQLLERTEIEKVYREQGLSAGNKDYLKLGHVLGADGLLLLDAGKPKKAPNLPVQFGAPSSPVDLTVRLIAVKPGVVLSAERFSLSSADLADWASSYAKHLAPLLPKLSLLVKDALPISVVNLRCATQSAEAPEVERQLKLLTVERLSQERQFFVLERQRMQSLAEEKNLKLDDSDFWSGAYLLEGVVDQNGYAKDTITINARLTPPRGGAALSMEVSGSRTNFVEVINRLVARVNEALKIKAAAPEWNAAEEATQYYNEAKWALGWEAYGEAQAAAESAWALGKRDSDGALLRIKAHVQEIPRVEAPGVGHFNFKTGREPFNYVHTNEPPDPKYCEAASYGLKCYYEFIRTSPDGGAKLISSGKDWYLLGIDTLVAASGVLEHFNHFPQLQTSVAEKLPELRALARSVAELISKAPSVHDGYFVGDRLVTHDELSHTMQENPNIFRCKVDWGCYWQERPEDTIALYRELMSSPVFCYLHADLWMRPAERPRLVAWNASDRQRIPATWDDFLRELKNSPDILLQLEAKAFAVTDAKSEQKKGEAFTNFFDSLFENRAALLTNNVEVVYMGWGAGSLVPDSGVVTAATELWKHAYRSEYWPKLQAMDREYWTKTIPTLKVSSAFQQQKQYLKDKRRYNFREFEDVFESRDYSKAQALELQPLVVGYISNLVAQGEGLSDVEKFKMQSAADWINLSLLQNGIQRILNAPAVKPRPQAPMQVTRPAAMAKMPAPVSANPPENVTNIFTVDKFLEIPLEDLKSFDRYHSNQISGVNITAHHWVDGKLLLDLNYGASVHSFDAKSNWLGTRNVTYPAIALLDPNTGHWDVLGLPEASLGAQYLFYHRSALWRGELFTSNGNQIKKYDFKTREWKVLDISDGNNYGLFAVNGHLYAANGNKVFEIIDDGKGTRLLASTRRQPPLSVLDTQDLGTPTLFEGPGGSLRIVAANKILTWTGQDWREDGGAPATGRAPVILTDGLLFYGSKLSRLATESTTVETCLEQKDSSANPANFFRPGTAALASPRPTWEMPPGMYLARLAPASHQSDLYLLVDHSETHDVIDERQHLIVGRKVMAKGGYHAGLLRFSRDMPLPQKLYLKFDAPNGRPPAAGSPAWMFFAGDYLFFGVETSPIGPTPTGDGYKAGVWLMPVSRLQPAVAAQKKAPLHPDPKP